MKGVAILIILCSLAASLPPDTMILAGSNFVSLSQGTNPTDGCIKGKEDFPRRSMKHRYIIPGKGPPVNDVIKKSTYAAHYSVS
jgi:hypothetical protein